MQLTTTEQTKTTTRQTTPVDASRNSRPSRGAPYPKPLHLYPRQLPPSAQVGGGHAHKQRDTGKDTRGSMALAASQFGRTAGDNRRYWGEDK